MGGAPHSGARGGPPSGAGRAPRARAALRAAALAAGLAPAAGARLAVVTYMNAPSNRFAYLQVSAAEHSMYPQILGYGDVAWWPDGLGAKINALRRFVLSDAADEDVVLFLDAFDVLVFAGPEEVMARFAEMEARSQRSIFFNAEEHCAPDFQDICTASYPKAPDPRWRYLNSGMLIGRGAALKEMLRDPVDDVIPFGDQTWYQRYLLRHQDRVAVDVNCTLLCTTTGVGAPFGFELVGRHLENTALGSRPAAVHFVGGAHWPIWVNGTPTTLLHDVFSRLYPSVSERLLGSIELLFQIGGAYENRLLSLRGSGFRSYVRFVGSVLCLRCTLGSADRECAYVSSWTSQPCGDLAIVLLVLGQAVAVAVAVVASRRSWLRARPCVRSRVKLADHVV